MTDFVPKAKIVFGWLKNLSLILFFREFFIFYLQRVIELRHLPQDKSYLKRIPGLVSGYCSRHFLYYTADMAVEKIRQNAAMMFSDTSSKELYETVFKRSTYSSHFIPGWENHYEPQEVYERKLNDILSQIAHPVEFTGNFFISLEKDAGNPILRYKNGDSWRLPTNWFEVSVFSFHLGLKELPNEYMESIRERQIIDVGAFIGDSSIVLAKYTNRKVLAIEPHKQNYESMLKTLRLNGKETQVEPCHMALDKEKRTIGISNNGAGSRIVELEYSNCNNSIGTTTLDELAEEKGGNVGLIKMDVEGFEMNILLGSEKVIKKYKPVLLLSIYHSGEQFYEIPKLMKEKYGDIYRFRFIDTNPVQPLSEKVLLCLPNSST